MTDEHSLYDPLHGPVMMTELERQLMMTTPLLRARNIKQLGTAAFLRNAPHTRFMHSIGVMHLVGQALDALFGGAVPDMRVTVPARPDADGKRVNLDGTQVVQCFRVAGLLHDIGHGPMSHVLESYIARLPPSGHAKLWKELDPGGLLSLGEGGKAPWPDRPPTHEDVTRLLIEDPAGKIAPLLIESGLDTHVVAGLALGSFDEEQYSCLGALISGSYDLDRLDYSLRDTYYLGRLGRRIGYSASFDCQSFLRELALYENPKSADAQYDLGVSEAGVHLLDQFFALRSHFLREVARNTDVRIADLHFIAALQDLTDGAWSAKKIARLMTEWTDADLVALLVEQGATAPLGRIMTGPSSFGAAVDCRLNRYPTVLRHRLILQAADGDFALEKILKERLADRLGMRESECTVLVGLNIPTDIPRANVRFEGLPKEVNGRPVNPGRNYPDVSPYARAYAKDAFASTSIVATTPHLDSGDEVLGFLNECIKMPVDGTSHVLPELLDYVKPLGWYGSRKSQRVDVALAAIRIALEVAARRLASASRAPKKRIDPKTLEDSLWIRGAIAIQELVTGVQEALIGIGYEHPYAFSTTASGRPFSHDLSNDLFVLDQAGMIRSQRVPVPRTGGGPTSLRYDYQMTSEGRSYTDDLFASSGWSRASSAIRAKLENLKGSCVDCANLAVGLGIRGEVCTNCAKDGHPDRSCSVGISSGVAAAG